MSTQLANKENGEKTNEIKVFTDEITQLVIKSDPEMMKLYLLVQSGMFPDIESFKEAFTKYQIGKELGLGLFASLKLIYIQPREVWSYKQDESGRYLKDKNGYRIKDKLIRVERTPGIYSAGIAALLRAHKRYNYTTLIWDETKCEVIIWRDGKKLTPDPVVYTIEDAKAKKLLIRDAWKAAPKTMLFYRALSKAVKQYAPDVLVFGATNLDTQDSGPVIEIEEDSEELSKEQVVEQGEQAVKELC